MLARAVNRPFTVEVPKPMQGEGELSGVEGMEEMEDRRVEVVDALSELCEDVEDVERRPLIRGGGVEGCAVVFTGV